MYGKPYPGKDNVKGIEQADQETQEGRYFAQDGKEQGKTAGIRILEHRGTVALGGIINDK